MTGGQWHFCNNNAELSKFFSPAARTAARAGYRAREGLLFSRVTLQNAKLSVNSRKDSRLVYNQISKDTKMATISVVVETVAIDADEHVYPDG